MKNNRLKQGLCTLLALLLLLSLAGCASKSTGEYANTAPAYETADGYYDYDGPPLNTEEYSAIREGGLLSVTLHPLSTFAADVDTASYANLRRMIEAGNWPVPDAVRIEEMLNYFWYDYPAPAGDAPFSVTTEIGDCPWNADTKLLLIGLQAEKIDAASLPPSNFVFLIDVSGSMNTSDKLPLVKRAFRLFTEQLGPDDRVSIVTYASGDQVVLSGARGDETDRIMAAIENLYADGATAGAKGIETAYRIAQDNWIEGGNNRVLLATDGDLNVGVTSEGELTRLIKEKKRSGIALSVLGFGTGNIKDNKMQALADNGDGNYSYIDSIYEARKVLVEEMGGTCYTVAKDVKLQVEFNPAYIKGYRLIGYENRVMDAEDFADDTKDGGEIGSGHRMTALYEIVPITSTIEIEDDLKYQTQGGNASNEWLTMRVRYKQPNGNVSALQEYPVTGDAVRPSPSDNLRFAAAVAEVGMLLRDSEYAGESSLEQALALLDGTDSLPDDAVKQEFRALVEKLARMDRLTAQIDD